MTTYTISEAIRTEIAQAIVRESHPGYSREYMGQHYAVDTDGDDELDTVYFLESQAQWNPWHDEATAIPVADLFDGSADFSDAEDYHEQDAIAFALSELPKTWSDDEEEIRGRGLSPEKFEELMRLARGE